MATQLRDVQSQRTIGSYMDVLEQFGRLLRTGPRGTEPTVFGKQFMERHILGLVGAVIRGESTYAIDLTGGADLKEAFPGLSGDIQEDIVLISRRLGSVFSRSRFKVDVDSRPLLDYFQWVRITVSWEL